MYRYFFKSRFDFLFAFIALILLSPVFLVITVLLAVSNHGNPFFIQKRPGKNGEVFNIIKFKTMSDEKDLNGKLLPDHRRLSFFGKIIRKMSLDEIPQLINVLKGEMSLVGPRPLLPEYLSLYTMEQRKRHHVKPGITGWAQVNGRNALSWEEKFRFDIEYVDNISLGMDAKIILITLEKVIKRHGVNTDNHITMEVFKGNVA
jgi:lipopolysaccharide/colanic/teichoic acid biosynthesis glycosyltransferase